MAKIENLIADIRDASLRADIAAEVQKLKADKTFGLVFENHTPEWSYLYHVPVKVGANVVLRGERGIDVYRVESVNKGSVEIVHEGDDVRRSVTQHQLAVLKRFGEAIYPSLIPVEAITKNPSKGYNVLINSDNYHALQLMLYCYEGMVDVIYIDPPYNKGAKDWKYNNDYVDKSDAWKHSKWLSMIEKRLRLARRLLKPDGVLIVTIDENEVHHLGVLLEKVFPNAYRQLVTIVVNPKGVTQGRFSRVEEYANYCFLGSSVVKGVGDDLLTPLPDEEDDDNGQPRWKGLLRSGTNARRTDRKNMFYPVLVDVERGAVLGAGETVPFDDTPDFDAKVGGLTAVYPIRRDGSLGNWGVGAITLRRLIEKGYVALGTYDEKRNTYGISYLSQKPQAQIAAGILEIVNFDEVRNVVDVRYIDVAERQVKTVWHRTSHDAGAYGSDLLKNILGKSGSFSFPKSLYAVRDSLAAICRDNKNALILDFFAGSGTTLHATALLNGEDAGNRRCILVTNNEVDEEQTKVLQANGFFAGDKEFEEHGICEAVTFPRCKFVINGKRSDGVKLKGTYFDGREFAAGFDENLAYFRLDFLDPNDVAYGAKFEAVLPILWLMSGAIGALTLSDDSRSFYLPEGSPFAVLIKESYFDDFKQAIAHRDDLTHIFLVTDSESAFRDMSGELGHERHMIMLYKNYLDNFRLNIDRST